MSDQPKDDPAKYPALGRMFGWVDRPGSANKIFWGLIIVCIALFFADFTYTKYGALAVESWTGFFGYYGFISFTGVVLLSKALRVFIKRPQDFYDDKSIDTEDYPASGLERLNHDAD